MSSELFLMILVVGFVIVGALVSYYEQRKEDAWRLAFIEELAIIAPEGTTQRTIDMVADWYIESGQWSGVTPSKAAGLELMTMISGKSINNYN